MGTRELKKTQYFCDRCEEILAEYDRPQSPTVISDTCKVSIIFPKKDRLGFTEESNSLAIYWTHLCHHCEEWVFREFSALRSRDSHGH